MRFPRFPSALALVASCVGTSWAGADDAWYLGVQTGTAQVSQAGFYHPTPGPQPLSFAVCGGTAAALLSSGSDMLVTGLDETVRSDQLFVGWRRGRFNLELARFSIPEFGLHGSAPAAVTAQPVCTPPPGVTVAVDNVADRTVSYSGYRLSPGFTQALGEDWSIELHVSALFWTLADDRSIGAIATEFPTGVIGAPALQSYPVGATTVYANDMDGVDFGWGLGVRWQATERLMVRGSFEVVSFHDTEPLCSSGCGGESTTIDTISLGLAFGF